LRPSAVRVPSSSASISASRIRAICASVILTNGGRTIPVPVLASLTTKMARLNPRAVNWTLATLAEEIADGCAHYGDATGFARALDRDLDWPELIELALGEVERKERGSVH
jgi:hypothetical protein